MLAFTVGIFSLTGSTVFVGWIFDRFGTRITRIISMILFSSGSLMLGFANSDIPVLIFPGLCCFGIGGIMLLVTNMQIGNYFNVARLTVVTLYNATFDTSSSMLLMIKVLHAAGVKRLHCFITLCILNVVIVSISTFALLPKFKVFPKDRKDKRNKVLVELIPNEDDTTDGIKMGKLSEISETVKEKDSLTPVDVEMEPLPTMMTVKGLKDYLVSRVYLFELMWHAIIQLQFNYYMGTLNTMITDITNNDTYKVSFLTNVFSYILMCGIFFGPLEGLFLHLEKKRLQRDNPSYYDQLRPAALPQALCSTLCLLLSVLVLIPVEKLLYLQFISLTIFRAFLYGMNSAFLFMAFPVEHFGRLFGVLMTVNGIIGALQYPLFKWGEGPPKNYLPPSVFMIVLVSLSYLQPIAVMFGEKTDQIFKRLRCK
ncbi:equilibrative nucleobase transporter 1-like [Tubulanus polymorphus]|uniref:equilibrative nucleobase transporter 1-like n=1 Tax=Tubulanus polymorphus TaxID=672921 RepID=UPI003DA3141C